MTQYKLVPVEPTEEMLSQSVGPSVPMQQTAKAIYVSMLAAAPQPAQSLDFASSVAARKWADLKAEGCIMKSISFEAPGKRGTIDPWGVVRWDWSAPAQPLRAAAQAVLDRWHSPQWQWTHHGPTADLMADLRRALDAQPAPDDLERECKAVDELLALLGLDPERCRTEGGAVNMSRVRSLLEDRRPVTDEMVSRFLGWKLPPDFSPDCGISFKRTHSETSPWGPQKYEPTGTNLLMADQARAMLEYVLAGAPTQAAPATAPNLACKSVQKRLAAQWGYVPAEQAVSDVSAERDRIRALVDAVRDANAAEAHGDYPFRVLTHQQERAWVALMDALNDRSQPDTTALQEQR